MAPFFSGTPSAITRTPRFRQGGEQGFDLLRQLGMSGLQQGPADFQPIEDLARYKHKTETVPSIAERFTGMGAQRSSGFQEAMQRGGEGLDLGLAGLRSQHGLQQQGQLMQMLGMGLQPMDQLSFQEEKPSGLANIIGQGAGGIGPLLQMYMQQQGGGGYGGQQQQGAFTPAQQQGGKQNWGSALASIAGGAASGGMAGGPAGAAVGGGIAGLMQLLSYLGNRSSRNQQSGSVELTTPRYKI